MKRTNLILAILGVVSLLLASALAQQLLPPNAGTYYCYTSQYNPAEAVVYSISYTPAFFGNVILDGKGNYTLTGRKTSGKYMFDKASGIMTFTSDLKIMRYQNYPSQKDTFLLIYQDLAFVCGPTNNASKPQGSSGRCAFKYLHVRSYLNLGGHCGGLHHVNLVAEWVREIQIAAPWHFADTFAVDGCASRF
jgi:hypothetical protein